VGTARHSHPSTNLQSAIRNPLASHTPDPGLEARVAAAIQHSRQSRTPLTLALFEIDRFADVLIQLGPIGATEAAYSLRSLLGVWTGHRGEAHLVSDNRLAMLWGECPRSDAVRVARQILSTVKPWSRGEFPIATNLTLSVGLATLEIAAKNYPATDLISAAQRCLSASQLSGGDTVKSIEF